MKNLLLIVGLFITSVSAVGQLQYNNVADMLQALQNPSVLRKAASIRTLGYVTPGNALDWRWDSTNVLTTNLNRLMVGTNLIGRLVHDLDSDVLDAVNSITEVETFVENNEAITRKLSNSIIPLTVASTSYGVTPTFSRTSTAYDPFIGDVVSTNTIRSTPISMGVPAIAALVEPSADNKMALDAYPYFGLGRMTVATNISAVGPFGYPMVVNAYTETAVTGAHYIQLFRATNTPGSPVFVSWVIKPNNPDNTLFTFRTSNTNSVGFEYCDLRVDFGEETPVVTLGTSTSDFTFHNYGLDRLDAGWWRLWYTATATASTPLLVTLAGKGYNSYLGDTSLPLFYQTMFDYSPLSSADKVPTFPLSATNSSILDAKAFDSYSFSMAAPWKASAGTLMLWAKTFTKQPIQSTLFEGLNFGGLRVDMSRTNFVVTAKATGSTNTFSAELPEMVANQSRNIHVVWTTNSIRAFVDGYFAADGGAPTGHWTFDKSAQIGAAVGLTNSWNGLIAAAYLPEALTDSEVSYSNNLLGLANASDPYTPLSARSGTEGVDAPFPMGSSVWSPRSFGEDEPTYDFAEKAAHFHSDVSIWTSRVYDKAKYDYARSITPRVGLWFSSVLTFGDPAVGYSNQLQGLMVDLLTGQNMKPSWYNFSAGWYSCVSRPPMLTEVSNRFVMWKSWGVTDIQMDDAENNYMVSRGTSYRYGTGTNVGTLGAKGYGCACPDCQARATALGFGTLTTNNAKAFARVISTNFWSYVGALARSNNIKLSGNLRYGSDLGQDGFVPGRFHYPLIEEFVNEVTGDNTVYGFIRYGPQYVPTLAYNTQSFYEEPFGPTDKTRRWMCLRYAIGALPIAPWNVYANSVDPYTYAARQDVADITGFVRAKAADLFNGFSLASAKGETIGWPGEYSPAAWADSTNIFVSVRYRSSDGKRVIHAVDLRDTPGTWNLSWIGPVVGIGDAIEHKPAVYNETVQDAAIASGDRSALAVQAPLSASAGIIRVAPMSAALWRIIEVAP